MLACVKYSAFGADSGFRSISRRNRRLFRNLRIVLVEFIFGGQTAAGLAMAKGGDHGARFCRDTGVYKSTSLCLEGWFSSDLSKQLPFIAGSLVIISINHLAVIEGCFLACHR
jgi:hypothetical protein